LPLLHRDTPTLLLAVALTLAVFAGCSHDGTDTPSGGPGKGVYIPLEWQTARAVNNHRVHVAREHVACSRCHEIGTDSMGPVTPTRCAECHEKQARFEHAKKEAQTRFGSDARVDCTLCHAFTVDGTVHPADTGAPLGHGDAGALALGNRSPHVPAPTDCNRCHATAQGNTPAVLVHGTSECVKCHKPHEDAKGSIGPCPLCHEKISTEHATQGKEPSEACVTCHAHPHAPASEAISTCVTCHATTEPKVPSTALFKEGHRECIGCHRPHEFTKAAARPCRSCHEDVHVLGTPRVAAHERCENCHAPHDVRAVGDATCGKCHENVHPDHPKVGGATCTGCHDLHPSGVHAQTSARACSGCHQVAASESAFHNGIACQKCHVPHDFQIALSNHAACASCHQKQTTLTATLSGHAACEGCHRGLPHHPTRLEASCDACHAGIQAEARPGHAECKSCHEPHGGTLIASCKTCHAAEARTANPGHVTCTQCHDQHTGSTAAAPCSKCHEKEQASFHGKVAEGCTSCHRPHGPGGIASPPACKTCHEPDKLSGLHSVKQHQDCIDCHTAHGDKPAPLRAMCVSCHQNRKEHFPDSPSCGSCHLFGPTR
jgi:hypothetical protein